MSQVQGPNILNSEQWPAYEVLLLCTEGAEQEMALTWTAQGPASIPWLCPGGLHDLCTLQETMRKSEVLQGLIFCVPLLGVTVVSEDLVASDQHCFPYKM